jgi:RNA polymerase sigma-70 factor, ECF subfamily
MTACSIAGELGCGMLGEAVLIARAKKGDLQAFNQLVLNYQGLAYSVAYSILGDGDSAGDATQDGFIKAYRALDCYWDGSFRAWLMRIVTNTCYDHLRSRRRQRQHVGTLDDLRAQEESKSALHDRRTGPVESAEGQELRRVIRQGLTALRPDQRTVVILYDLEGFSYEEIARATAAPIGTVKSRLSRGRAHLRDYLRSRALV